MNFLKNILIAAVVTVTTLSLASCGVSRSSVSAPGRPAAASGKTAPSPKKNGSAGGRISSAPEAKPAARIDFASIPSLTPTLERVLREADSWIGTPYLYGGNDRNGVDCSGFVLQVYLKAAEIALPRTSRQQQEYCRDLTRDQLEPGDLVFFSLRGGETVGHVGIYIGNDQMIHASSSKGVVISSLSTNYYVQNYYGGGRIDRFFSMVKSERGGAEKKPVASPAVKPAPAKSAEPRQPSVYEAPKAEIAGAKVEKTESKEDISSAIAARVSRIGKFDGKAAAGGGSRIVVVEDNEDDELTDLFD